MERRLVVDWCDIAVGKRSGTESEAYQHVGMSDVVKLIEEREAALKLDATSRKDDAYAS